MTTASVKLPHMVKAESSNVVDFGHDRTASELHVRYKDGSHYVYADVPESVYHEMIAADSTGGFLFRHVRGKFTHRKL